MSGRICRTSSRQAHLIDWTTLDAEGSNTDLVVAYTRHGLSLIDSPVASRNFPVK